MAIKGNFRPSERASRVCCFAFGAQYHPTECSRSLPHRFERV